MVKNIAPPHAPKMEESEVSVTFDELRELFWVCCGSESEIGSRKLEVFGNRVASLIYDRTGYLFTKPDVSIKADKDAAEMRIRGVR
jgi:hypothetical protein